MSINSSSEEEIKNVQPSYMHDDGGEITHMVTIEGNNVPLHKVLHAYAGLARPGTYYAPNRNLPSMAPVGLIGFAVPNIILGCLLTQARGVTIPNFAICAGWFSGGVGLFTAGMWEFVLENALGSTACTVYGLYWFAMCSLYTPSFGMAEAFMGWCERNADKLPAQYPTIEVWATETMTKAFGCFALAYMLFGLMLVLTLLKSTVAFLACMGSVFCIFVFITAGYFSEQLTVVKVAGGFTFVAGIIALLNGFAGIMTKENSYIQIKPILLPGSKAPPH